MRALTALWSRMGRPRILVVGDLVLDRYTFGAAERISPEAPVLILRETQQDSRPGGAANVASFLRHLEADVMLAGIIGADAAGQTMLRLLHETGVETDGVLTVTSRPTTEKLRFVGQTGSRTPHHLLRVDREVNEPLDPRTELRLLAALQMLLPTCDAVILSDYAKGVLTPQVLRMVIDSARQLAIPVLVDPARGGDYQRYTGATLVAPNRLAASLWAGHPLQTPEQILTAVRALRTQLQLPSAVITLDRDGLAYADGQGCELVPGMPRDVCDVTGAGDMVQAVLGLCLAEGLPLPESLAIANLAAGREVEQFGVVPLTREAIAAELRGQNTAEKLTTLPSLVTAIESARRLYKTVVFTNGCFDLLHPGHVQMLQDAANALWVSKYADNFFTIESVDRLYRSGGHVTVERLTYAYSGGSTTVPLLTSVTLQRRVDDGSWENVQKVEYAYYGTSDTHGAEGDLESVTTHDWSGSAWEETGTTVYRYWLSNGSSSSSSGADAAHLLKFVLQPASYVRMVDAGHDPLTASDGLFSLFADYYFEYDEQRRVTKELVQAGSQTFLYGYEESGFADDPNAWKMKTTETLPDGSQNIVYSNYAGRTMLTVFQSDGKEWRTFQRFDGSERAVLTASPSPPVERLRARSLMVAGSSLRPGSARTILAARPSIPRAAALPATT